MGLRDEIAREIRALEATLPEGASVLELNVYRDGDWYDGAYTLKALSLPEDDTALPPGFTVRATVEYPPLSLPVWGESHDRDDYVETARKVRA
jgi:hypothetical protein